MPAIQCPNGKWKWGEKGPCTFETEADANRWGYAYEERKKNGRRSRVNR